MAIVKRLASEDYVSNKSTEIVDNKLEEHVVSWKGLEDKPTEFIGRYIFKNTGEHTAQNGRIKVSDVVLSLEDFANGYTVTLETGEVIEYTADNITVGNILDMGATNAIKCNNGYFIILPKNSSTPSGTTFSKGVYFYSSTPTHTVTVLGKEILKEDVIPDTIARATNIPLGSVGEAVVVKAVDENSKPTEWATTELFSGSWIDLADKPTEFVGGRTFTKSFSGFNNYGFKQVSDIPLSLEDFANGYTVTLETGEILECTADDISIGGLGYLGSSNLIKGKNNYIVSLPEEYAPSGMTPVPKGVYFYNASMVRKVTVRGNEEKLKEDIIPDTIARTSDIPEINYPVTSVNGMTGDVEIVIPEQKDITVNGVAPDENGNIEIEVGGSAGVSSWNDLEDKPFYEEGSGATIEWDGNTEGRDSFTFTGTGLDGNPMSVPYYKVSDLTPSKNEIIGGNIDISGYTFTVDENEIAISNEEITALDFFIISYGTTFTLGGNVYLVPSPGIYSSMAMSLTYGSSTIKTLDEKFIPDTIARTSDMTALESSLNATIAGKAAQGDLDSAIERLDVLEAIDHDAYIAADETLKNELNEKIVQGDWSVNDEDDSAYIKGRTHWIEETSYEHEGTFDGDVSSKTYNKELTGQNMGYVRLTTDTITNFDNFIGGEIKTYRNGAINTNTITKDEIVDISNSDKVSAATVYGFASSDGSLIIVTSGAGTITKNTGSQNGMRVLLSGAGIWVWYEDRDIMGQHISEYVSEYSLRFAGESIVHQLDEKYIPDTIARVEDVTAPKTELILTSSTSGSSKQFKITIDDEGVITAAEIVEDEA